MASKENDIAAGGLGQSPEVSSRFISIKYPAWVVFCGCGGGDRGAFNNQHEWQFVSGHCLLN